MKKVYIILVLIILFTGSIATAQEQNLAKMSREKRDTYLIALAEEVVLKFGPDYYRDDYPPIIERKMITSEEIALGGGIELWGGRAGRWFYKVIFKYDTAQEKLDWDYAARVEIWEDNGNPFGVTFGNGWGYNLKEDWRTNETIGPMKYQESEEIPVYEWNHPERDPVNLNELKRRGYEKKLIDGEERWIKTRPDVPPARRKKEK
jgi:hypothetical protein